MGEWYNLLVIHTDVMWHGKKTDRIKHKIYQPCCPIWLKNFDKIWNIWNGLKMYLLVCWLKEKN